MLDNKKCKFLISRSGGFGEPNTNDNQNLHYMISTDISHNLFTCSQNAKFPERRNRSIMLVYICTTARQTVLSISARKDKANISDDQSFQPQNINI